MQQRSQVGLFIQRKGIRSVIRSLDCSVSVSCACRDHACGREQEGDIHQATAAQGSSLHPEGQVLETGQRDGKAPSVDKVPVPVLLTVRSNPHETK